MMVSGSLTDRRILVVEDEYILARQLVRALTQEGAVVLGPVPDVARALALIDEGSEKIDAAILDVNLVGEKVYPVADALLDRGVPFLFASGYDADEGDPRFAAIPHLVKPLMMKSLVAALIAILAAPGDG
ncbi:response regulator [Sphingomonas sp. CFBP 8760]|uniref:response regulator n=1 Tax=Sphingomonas sp. CFBP 8760 TaxID=2775282 RepID=UPI001FCE6A71|nr:response regulator [Sphingomonas sp. CFBP 8760]